MTYFKAFAKSCLKATNTALFYVVFLLLFWYFYNFSIGLVCPVQYLAKINTIYEYFLVKMMLVFFLVYFLSQMWRCIMFITITCNNLPQMHLTVRKKQKMLFYIWSVEKIYNKEKLSKGNEIAMRTTWKDTTVQTKVFL